MAVAGCSNDGVESPEKGGRLTMLSKSSDESWWVSEAVVLEFWCDCVAGLIVGLIEIKCSGWEKRSLLLSRLLNRRGPKKGWLDSAPSLCIHSFSFIVIGPKNTASREVSSGPTTTQFPPRTYVDCWTSGSNVSFPEAT